MNHKSILRKLTAALLSCTLCCTGMTVPAFAADDADELPAHFDWREEAPEILTPVKSQIGGTCWAYSTLSCIESNMIRKGMADSSIDLSETHLVWFTDGQGSPTDPADTRYGGGLEYGVKGYNAGAYVTVILASLGAWQGVAYESDFPSLTEKSVLDESLRYQSAAHLQNAQYYAYTVKQIPFTKQRLTERGPIKLDYCHDYDHPLSEKSGYYNPDYVSVTKANGGTHGVVLVGWDDRYAKENFTKEPPGDGAWIIRNSWGNYENSEDGYFYMSYYEPSISTLTSYDCEPATNYGSIHSYNCTYIKAKPLPSSQHGYYTANVFEAQMAERIAAVGFLLNMPRSVQTQYELSVYLLNPAPAGPQDGTLVCQTEGTADLSGLYTVKLPECIAVEKGQKYSVVMKTSAGTMCFFDDASYKEGVSYYAYHTAGQTEPIAWTDCFGTDFGDACIQVYTEYEGETAQILPGDMDRDGSLTAADLSLMKQAICTPERSDLYQPAADWNGDSVINAEDAHGLLRFLLQVPEQEGLPIRLPIR